MWNYFVAIKEGTLFSDLPSYLGKNGKILMEKLSRKFKGI